MEPRPEPTRAATPPLRVASSRIRRRGERKVGFEGAQSRGESRVERNTEGGRPLEETPRGNGGQSVNLTLLLAAHLALKLPRTNPTGKPFYGGNSCPSPTGGARTTNLRNSNMPSQNGFTYPTNMPTNSYPFYTQPMYTFPNVPMYTNPNLIGAVLNPVGSVTPFVRWIKDYPLPNGLKTPSHIGSYDGKEDPHNFLHLFEGAIRMQKWLMPVACHMFTYTLKDSARIWWNSQKADDSLQILGLHEEQRTSGFIHGLRTRSLIEHLSTNLPSTYKGLMEKTYTWVKAREGKKKKFKSIALKDKKESSDDETSTSRSDDEEYAMAVRNFKKFFRRKVKFCKGNQEQERSHAGQRDEKKGKGDRKCFRCGDTNHLIGDCPKPSRNKDQKAFIRGS
ncbi:reverse transcriptase domain-containing protein [Tanacetum coccineum]